MSAQFLFGKEKKKGGIAIAITISGLVWFLVIKKQTNTIKSSPVILQKWGQTFQNSEK